MADTPTSQPLVQTTVEAPVVTAAPPPVETNTSPIVSPTPVEAPVAPVIETVAPTPAPVVEVAPEAPKAPETVLGEALKPAEAPKPAVTDPTEAKPEVKETEGGQSDEPAPPPKYEPFSLPEGITLDDGKLGEFTGLLAELETSGKASHEAVQAFGQKAVEFYVNEAKSIVDNVTKLYQTTWDKQKVTWKEQFLADPEIGGNRFQTTVDSALTFIRTHGGTTEQQQEFRTLMESSGLGNHPTMIRLLANAGKSMSEGTPLVATTPVSAPKSKITTMYGSNT